MVQDRALLNSVAGLHRELQGPFVGTSGATDFTDMCVRQPKVRQRRSFGTQVVDLSGKGQRLLVRRDRLAWFTKIQKHIAEPVQNGRSAASIADLCQDGK